MILSRNRLIWIGWANVAVGVVSILRVVAEIVCFSSSFFDSRVATLFGFDAMEATLWIASGVCLVLRDPGGLEWTVIAAGAAAARTILSINPLLSVSEWALEDDPQSLSMMATRFLHYGLEFVYWPVVLFQVFKVCEAPIRGWRVDCGTWAGLVFAAAVLTTALLQVTILTSFR